MANNTIRVDKYLSSIGLTSRRNVERYIKLNKITIDGKRVLEPGERFSPKKSKLEFNGKPLKMPKRVYFMLNKPKGIVSTAKDEFGRKNVVSLIKTDERIFPIGRLDRDTSGLLILTNDGELTNFLIHPRYHISKIYQLTIKGQVFPPQIEKFEKGVMLEDGPTQPARLQIVQRRKDATVLDATLFEGRKRQIRRMCEALNLPLLNLTRIKFGPLELGDLKVGEYRLLESKEVELLKKTAIANNGKTIRQFPDK